MNDNKLSLMSDIEYKTFLAELKEKVGKSQQAVDQLEHILSIPWGHHTLLISKCKSIDEALFYVSKTVTNG